MVEKFLLLDSWNKPEGDPDEVSIRPSAVDVVYGAQEIEDGVWAIRLRLRGSDELVSLIYRNWEMANKVSYEIVEMLEDPNRVFGGTG